MTFLVIGLLAGIFFGVRYYIDPHRELIRNRDSEVVNAALLYILKTKNDRNIPDWYLGDFIVVSKEFNGEAPVLLSKLDLDDRIVVSQRKFSSFDDNIKIQNRQGVTGSVFAYGTLTPPLYSLDGQTATICMDGVPYGWHAARITMMLLRINDGWKVIHTEFQADL